MNKTWKLILLLVGIFLAGGVAGSFLTIRFGRNWLADRAAPAQWAEGHIRKLAERLELRPEQIEQLKPIIRRNMEDLGRLRTESVAASRAVFERMEKEIAATLTPEQRVKFEEYSREKRERMHKLMQKRAEDDRPKGERPGEGPPPPPPPPGGPPREPRD